MHHWSCTWSMSPSNGGTMYLHHSELPEATSPTNEPGSCRHPQRLTYMDLRTLHFYCSKTVLSRIRPPLDIFINQRLLFTKHKYAGGLFHHTRSRIHYISCRLMERKINIQRIEYGLQKKNKLNCSRDQVYTIWSSGGWTGNCLQPQISTEPWQSLMKW